MTFWRTWVHESLPQDYKMKMADVNLTCEDLLERAAVSSSVDHPLMIEQVRSLPAACINISPDFSLKRQDFSPRKSGFVAAKIWICRLRNQVLWRRECQRHSGGGSFSAFSAARLCLSLFKTVSQSRREMKIKEEISGAKPFQSSPTQDWQIKWGWQKNSQMHGFPSIWIFWTK